MRFSEGHIKVDSFLRNITCERRDLISGLDLFHSLMLKCEKEFVNRSVLNIYPVNKLDYDGSLGLEELVHGGKSVL